MCKLKCSEKIENKGDLRVDNKWSKVYLLKHSEIPENILKHLGIYWNTLEYRKVPSNI